MPAKKRALAQFVAGTTHTCSCGDIHVQRQQPSPFGNCGACGSALPGPAEAGHTCTLTYSRVRP